MRKIEIKLSGSVDWRVLPSVEHSPPIPALGNWCIASPLAVPHDREPMLVPLPDGTVLTTSEHLVLVSEDHADVEEEIEDHADVEEEIEKLIPKISPFLNALRVVAKQPTLPRSFCMVAFGRSFAGFLSPQHINRSAKCFVKKDMVDSAVLVNHLSAASDALLNGRVPIHCELANDAAENATQSNYRSAIIFAASAIEACAGNVLDREYSNLRTRAASAEHRLVSIQVNRHETIIKDPVYVALRGSSGEGGSQFLTLLHEIPLYLIGRSLQNDNEDLYRRAHSLYRTRNCLTHTGEIDSNKQGLLEVTHDGAAEALKVMNEVIEWFGETGTSLAGKGFIEVGTDSGK